MKTLEERIDEAHRKGDKRTLEKLQAEYRARGNPVIRYSSLPPVLVEPNSTRPHGAPVSVDDFLARRPSRNRSTRTTGPRVTRVLFAKGLRSDLQTRAWAEADGREAGGYLFGQRHGASVLVTDISETANAERTRHSIFLDIDEALRWQRDDPFIGCWHTHDTRYGLAEPSPTDRATLLRMSEKNPEGVEVGIILTPHPTYEWSQPLPTAYVAQLGTITPVPIEEVQV